MHSYSVSPRITSYNVCYTKLLRVLESSELSELTMGIMSEVKELARRSAVHLDKDIIALSMEKAKDFDFDTTTSFQRDVEAKGATNESDLFGGTIIRLGREFNVATIVITSYSIHYTKLYDQVEFGLGQVRPGQDDVADRQANRVAQRGRQAPVKTRGHDGGPIRPPQGG